LNVIAERSRQTSQPQRQADTHRVHLPKNMPFNITIHITRALVDLRFYVPLDTERVI